MKIVVIGSSTGGPQALDMLLLHLPANLPVPVVILQHLPARFTASMAVRMNAQLPQTVSEVADGEVLQPGHVYVVPGDCNFFLVSPGPIARLVKNESHLSPSIDRSMTSVADYAGPDTIAVILTGMGKDGLLGTKAVKQVDGYVIAQDKETSVVYGMPQEVVKAGYADEELALERIPGRLIALVGT